MKKDDEPEKGEDGYVYRGPEVTEIEELETSRVQRGELTSTGQRTAQQANKGQRFSVRREDRKGKHAHIIPEKFFG